MIPTITPEERASPLWRKLSEYWGERLTNLRAMNDGDKDAIATANLRGKIAECRINLGLDKDLPEID